MWVARDETGVLVLYKIKPVKIKCEVKFGGGWYNSCTTDASARMVIGDYETFPEVKWEDEEPTEVELVIKKK